MKILAIDSSGMPASVAVCEDGTLVAEYTVNNKKTHSQTLVPMMDEVRRVLGLDLESVDAVAISGGPGSFTGLRIGSAVAKGIGLALDKPLIHVPTLEAMACNYYGSDRLVVPMIDARNHQVFAGIYTFRQVEDAKGLENTANLSRSLDQPGAETPSSFLDQPGAEAPSDSLCQPGSEAPSDSLCQLGTAKLLDPLCVINDQEPLELTVLCERLNDLWQKTGKGIILLGDGAAVYRDLLEEHLEAPHMYAPAHLSQQRAGAVAVRGMELARQGRIETAAMHRPDYLRVSQAERVRLQGRS